MTAHNFSRCFELLTNTWSNVGCYDVQVVVHEVGKADTTKNVKMAHFSDCEEYKFKFFDQFSGWPTLFNICGSNFILRSS